MNNINDRLVTLYNNIISKLNNSSCDLINNHREEAIKQFKEWGVPTKKDENYIYSDVSAWLAEERFASYEPKCDCGEVLLQQLDNGIVIADINTFAKEYSEIFLKYYTHSIEDDAMMMLSRAFVSGGRVVYVPKNVVDTNYILLDEKVENGIVQFGRRDLFIFEKGSCAKLRLINNNSGIVNRVCEVFLDNDSNVEIAEEFYGSSESLMVSTLSVRQKTNSYYKHIAVNLSKGKCRANEYVTLSEKGCETSIFGAVYACRKSHIDNTTMVKHAAERCRSLENVKCVVDAEATSVFNGHVYVAPNAQQTEAYQQNNNILLSDGGNVYTKPDLEIYADDVKCSHGATVGQLDDQAIFYMRQRGLSIENAKRLMLTGFLIDIVSKISNPEIVEQITNNIEQNVCTI